VRTAFRAPNTGGDANLLSQLAHPASEPVTFLDKVKKSASQALADWTGTKAK